MPPKSRSRKNTAVACESCRKSQVKCDGSRPSCSRCVQKRLRCAYDTAAGTDSRRDHTQRRARVQEQILRDLRRSLDGLRGASTQEAVQALLAITNSEDSLGALAALPNMMPLPSGPSAHAINSATIPENLLPFQYELMMQHPHAFPAVIPMVHIDGDESALAPSHMRMITANASRSDPRLKKTRISYWTTVKIGNADACQLISHYLETDNPILGLFDADLFLDDFSTYTHECCSNFLVNCILFWACLSCSSGNYVARSQKSAFFQAAIDLWDNVKDEANITTVAGTQILSLACACEGDDALAQSVRNGGYDMSIKLGLFEPQGDSVYDGSEDYKLLRWRAHVAWGEYNWLSLHAFHYRQPPVGVPPSLPIPGDKSEDVDESPTASQSRFMVSTIPSLCKFWRILQPVIELLVPDANQFPVPRKLTLSAAEEIFQKLLLWADENLLAYSDNGSLQQPHHVLVMHMWFHTAVMEIFRPFYGKNWTLKTFDTRHSTPEILFWSSLTQLEHLALQYRQNHPSASSSIFWHLSLLFIGNAVVRNPTGPSWRFNFLLCMYGYTELAGSFRVADGFLRAILYMAVQKELISPSEARGILNRLPNNEVSETAGVNGNVSRIQSSHVADLELALADRSESQVGDLASKLEDILMFREFVDDTEDDSGSRGAELEIGRPSASTTTTMNGQINGYHRSTGPHRPSK